MKDVAQIPGYYTVDEAAKVIGVNRSQISRYIKKGRLPKVNVGQSLLIEQQAVHNFKRKPRGNPAFKRLATA